MLNHIQAQPQLKSEGQYVVVKKKKKLNLNMGNTCYILGFYTEMKAILTFPNSNQVRK